MQPDYFDIYQSPFGDLRIESTSIGISKLFFSESNSSASPILSNAITRQLKLQLDEYFKGNIKVFDIPLDVKGTEFQNKIWKLVKEVPYGKTISYLQLSKQLNNVDAIRAVAHANAVNPILILIPCHRVIGSNGEMTGYAGGIYRKQKLLELEGALAPTKQFTLDFN